MTTSISSEAQTNHGMDKQTKLVIEQMFSSHNKEKREYAKTPRKSRNLTKLMFTPFEA